MPQPLHNFWKRRQYTDGKGYDISHWKESRTFWIAEQENLLISDNQTALYHNADSSYRKILSNNAWGI